MLLDSCESMTIRSLCAPLPPTLTRQNPTSPLARSPATAPTIDPAPYCPYKPPKLATNASLAETTYLLAHTSLTITSVPPSTPASSRKESTSLHDEDYIRVQRYCKAHDGLLPANHSQATPRMPHHNRRNSDLHPPPPRLPLTLLLRLSRPPQLHPPHHPMRRRPLPGPNPHLLQPTSHPSHSLSLRLLKPPLTHLRGRKRKRKRNTIPRPEAEAIQF